MQKESELPTKTKSNDEELPKIARECLSLEETETSVSPIWSFSLCNVHAKDVLSLLKETIENFSNEGKSLIPALKRVKFVSSPRPKEASC